MISWAILANYPIPIQLFCFLEATHAQYAEGWALERSAPMFFYSVKIRKVGLYPWYTFTGMALSPNSPITASPRVRDRCWPLIAAKLVPTRKSVAFQPPPAGSLTGLHRREFRLNSKKPSHRPTATPSRSTTAGQPAHPPAFWPLVNRIFRYQFGLPISKASQWSAARCPAGAEVT